jgi:regulatory protein
MSTDDQARKVAVSLRRRAMDYLARREHSVSELRRKLTEKFPETDTQLLESVLCSLQDDGLLSDQRFAESYVRARFNKGYGPQYILSHLKNAGVPDDISSQELCIYENEWVLNLQKVVCKRFGSPLPQPGTLAWAKLERFAQARGFRGNHLQKLRCQRSEGEV